jgi:hypothetical protein
VHVWFTGFRIGAKNASAGHEVEAHTGGFGA